MTWAPAYAATDVRAIIGNLVTFFEENQEAALEWAKPGGSLEPFKSIYQTAQVLDEPDFPHMGVVREHVEVDDADDGKRITYSLTFILEVAAEFNEKDRVEALNQLKLDTKHYTYAVESMFLNCPRATLFANVTGTAHDIYRSVTSVDPVEAAANRTQAMFNVRMDAVLKFTENP